MLALSIRQPWAWLIVSGFKNIENRDWPTGYRGRFLVHASKTMTRSDWFACTLFLNGFSWGPSVIAQLPEPDHLQFGGIIGEATLLDCVRSHSSDWFCGEYGFVLADARPLPFTPGRGRLGFFTCPLNPPMPAQEGPALPESLQKSPVAPEGPVIPVKRPLEPGLAGR